MALLCPKCEGNMARGSKQCQPCYFAFMQAEWDVRTCQRCHLSKPSVEFVSRQKCLSCAQVRKCRTCDEDKPVAQFSQMGGKACIECRKSGKAKENKAQLSQEHYQADPEKRLSSNRKWKRDNDQRYRSQQKDYRREERRKKRDAVLSHYGGSCACCGEKELVFLTIDHMNGKGHEHRRLIGTADLWKWLYSNHYPEGFQILCYNCNSGRYRNGGRCPHVEE